METSAELTEIYAVSDTFVSGLGEVEDIGGGCYRFTFFTRYAHDGREDRQIVVRLVMPAEAVTVALKLVAKTTHSCICELSRAKTN